MTQYMIYLFQTNINGFGQPEHNIYEKIRLAGIQSGIHLDSYIARTLGGACKSLEDTMLQHPLEINVNGAPIKDVNTLLRFVEDTPGTININRFNMLPIQHKPYVQAAFNGLNALNQHAQKVRDALVAKGNTEFKMPNFKFAPMIAAIIALGGLMYTALPNSKKQEII